MDEQPVASAPVAGRGIPREALLLALTLLLVIAATNILTPLLPAIRDEFGVSIAMAGLIVGAYGMARLIVDLPAGFLVDRLGYRRMSVIALGLLVGSSLLGLIAWNVEVLIAARVGSGVGVGILATVIIAALSSAASATSRGKVMSMYHVANNVGIALYPLLGGVIGVTVGWRPTFAVTAALAVVAAVILLPLLLRMNLGGAVKATKPAAPETSVLHGRERTIALAAANYGVVANMIHRHGFRNTILPLYAAMALGLGGLSIATAIALMSITGLMVATPGGMLGDRIGRRRVISSGLAAVAVGDLVFLFTGDLVSFLLVAALIGFGDFFASSQTALLSEIVPAAQRTRALAGYRFSADLGALLGPLLLAAIMDVMSAQAAIIAAAVILITAALAARFGVPYPKSSAARGYA